MGRSTYTDRRKTKREARKLDILSELAGGRGGGEGREGKVSLSGPF